MLGGNSSAAAPSCKQASLPSSPFPQQSIPASLWPCLPCFRHSPPEDTVFRGTRFHHISAPMPRPHSPAASSQTAQCGAMADTQGLNFSPAALLKEKKLVSITDRKGARTKRQATQDAHWNKPPPEPLHLLLILQLASAHKSPGGLPEEQGEELSQQALGVGSHQKPPVASRPSLLPPFNRELCGKK
jgi:hypothetical protein